MTGTNTNIKYLIIGAGKVARYFSHYFALLKISSCAIVRDENDLTLSSRNQRLTPTTAVSFKFS